MGRYFLFLIILTTSSQSYGVEEEVAHAQGSGSDITVSEDSPLDNFKTQLQILKDNNPAKRNRAVKAIYELLAKSDYRTETKNAMLSELKGAATPEFDKQLVGLVAKKVEEHFDEPCLEVLKSYRQAHLVATSSMRERFDALRFALLKLETSGYVGLLRKNEQGEFDATTFKEKFQAILDPLQFPRVRSVRESGENRFTLFFEGSADDKYPSGSQILFTFDPEKGQVTNIQNGNLTVNVARFDYHPKTAVPGKMAEFFGGNLPPIPVEVAPEFYSKFEQGVGNFNIDRIGDSSIRQNLPVLAHRLSTRYGCFTQALEESRKWKKNNGTGNNPFFEIMESKLVELNKDIVTPPFWTRGNPLLGMLSQKKSAEE